jgi:hypothetical protein
MVMTNPVSDANPLPKLRRNHVAARDMTVQVAKLRMMNLRFSGLITALICPGFFRTHTWQIVAH